MKTFDEAIKSVCMADRRIANDAEKVTDRQIRSIGVIKEVVHSEGTRMLAITLLEQVSFTDFQFDDIVVCVKNAIAQGVLIGMEMEKSES
jgi:hypothetical protein